VVTAVGPLPVYLRLGRVSNLPTVWTNVVAGTVLAGAGIEPAALVALAIALSLFYEGGMFLNDAFDREIDARERPERPIPAGLVSVAHVFTVGFVLLGAGVALVAAVAVAGAGPGAWAAVAAGIALGGTIVYYDAHHKGNPLSPLLMGLCRVLVYVTAALAVAGTVSAAVLGGALALLAYLIGLTYIAKQETLTEVRNLWPLLFLAAPFVYALPTLGRPAAAAVFVAFLVWTLYALSLLVRRRGRSIPRAVVSLIAGISLLDALLVAGAATPALALVGVAGFALTLVLQRYVSGT
jgi:4-hydroxybenzoate polyprenyltransferase